MAQAMRDGTLYAVRGAGWVEYSPPAIDTPAECVAALGRVDPCAVGKSVRVDRILSGTIGARIVEDVPGPNPDGTWTVPVPPIPLCPECIGAIGGACGGPDAPYRPAKPGEPCGASDHEDGEPDAYEVWNATGEFPK